MIDAVPAPRQAAGPSLPEAADPALGDAFQAFAAVAARLQAAYDGLSASASRLDRELAEANVRLSAQVDELENLSGSLAAVLRAIPCGVVVADGGGVVVMANPAAESILGVRGRELIGRPAASLHDRAGAPLLLLPAGEGAVGERRLDVADSVRVVDGCVMTVTDTDGRELGLVEVLNDRTEVHALQQEVTRLDRLAELGRVAAIIAHEIRNPLSGIRGFAGMLERELAGNPDAAAPLRWARRINEGVEKADAIIDSVLFLARPRPLKSGAIDVEALFCDAIEDAAAAAPQRMRGVRVELDVQPSGLEIHGDRVRLHQALVNLARNALEALSGSGRLRLSARAAEAHAELVVADDGPGIPDEAKARLFEPFFTTKEDGAGLGLALVARIAELHGGAVRVEDALPRGTAFVLSLPCRKDPKEAVVA